MPESVVNCQKHAYTQIFYQCYVWCEIKKSVWLRGKTSSLCTLSFEICCFELQWQSFCLCNYFSIFAPASTFTMIQWLYSKINLLHSTKKDDSSSNIFIYFVHSLFFIGEGWVSESGNVKHAFRLGDDWCFNVFGVDVCSWMLWMKYLSRR